MRLISQRPRVETARRTRRSPRRRRFQFETLEDRRLLAGVIANDDAHVIGPDVVAPITGNLLTNDLPANPGDSVTARVTGGRPVVTDPRLRELESGFRNPVSVTHAGDGSGRVFVVEQSGQIQILSYGDRETDTIAPSISNSFTSVTETGAAISWQTDESATGGIEYGLTTDYEFGTVATAATATLHRGVLRDLSPDTRYHYRIVTTDDAGNQTLTSDLTLTTSAPSQAGETLYNGLVLPAQWPPLRGPSQVPEVASYLISPPQVIDIDVGRQLFVDDFLIDDTSLQRTQHRPLVFEDNPVLTPGDSDTNNFAMPYSDGVWYDPADNLFKLWYFGGNGRMLSYAYSNDGETWVKPQLANGVVPNTNQVLEVPGRDSATVWMDLNDPDPNKKFKFFVWRSGYIHHWVSPDGIEWTEDPSKKFRASDRTTVFYNSFRDVWVGSIRRGADLPAVGDRDAYRSRARYYQETEDLTQWNPPDWGDSYWVGPDLYDPSYYQPHGEYPGLYNLDAVAYESVMVGLFTWFHGGVGYGSYDDPGPILNEIGVGFSRDGYQWERPTRGNGDDAFISASNSPDTWDGYNTQSVGGGFLVVGDELWFYFSGRTERKPESGIASTGLAKLRRDGFYSMDAADTEGVLTTQPVRFSGDRLFVNVNNPQGGMRVEILDVDGNVISPFSKANSVPVSVNSTLHEVKWNGSDDLSSLAGQPVRFRFYLTSGELYSFWVSTDETGASQGYVAAGGPGFTGTIDTVGSTGYSPSNDASLPAANQLTDAPSTYVQPSPLLDIGSDVLYGGDRGLHSVAFHPEFAIAGSSGERKLYVHYSAPPTLGGDHDSVIAEYSVFSADGSRVDPSTKRVLMRINQPSADNNGGGLSFGPDDGLLYISIGDGGSSGVANGTAQDLGSLLGKVLRIDVDGTDGPNGNYGIPPSNPFVGQSGVRQEVFAMGLQDPRQLSIDDGPNGFGSPDRIFLADLGATHHHEVNIVTKGGNYGWPRMEGTQVVNSGVPDPGDLVDPIAQYSTDFGDQIVGGHINRSGLYPDSTERFLLADWNGRLLSIAESAGNWMPQNEGLFNGEGSGKNIIAVGADELGRVYVSSHDTVYVATGASPVDAHLGEFGQLVWDPDGTYIYTLDTANPAVAGLAHGQSLVDSFPYQIEDNSGATDTAMLTITIAAGAVIVDLHPLNVFEQKLDGQWLGSFVASDGKTYFASSTHAHDAAGLLFQYDPNTDTVRQVGLDLSRIVGEDPTIQTPQGKLHSQIVESDGWLYMSTYLGNYWDEAQNAYTGSHLLAYELGSLEAGQPNFIDFGIPIARYANYAAVAVSPEGRYLWSVASPWASDDAATAGARLLRTEIATGITQDFGVLTPDIHGPQASFAIHVDNRGDAWVTSDRGADRLFVGRAATGTIDVFPGALPAMTHLYEGERLSDYQDASWWRWGRSIDGEHFLFTIHDSHAPASEQSGGSLWEFDASKTLDGDLSDAFREVAWIGANHLGMTYSESNGTVYFVRRSDGSPNPKINAVAGNGEVWDPALDTGERLHLYSVRVDHPAGVVTDWGMITDVQGRIPWRIESVSASGADDEVYLTGDWVMKESDPLPWRTLGHDGGASTTYTRHIRGQAFTAAKLPTWTDLQVTTSADKTLVNAGDSITYSVVVTNHGPSKVSDTTVNAILSQDLTNVTWTAVGSDGAAGFQSAGEGNVHDVGIALAAGSSVSYVIQGILTPGTTATTVNCVANVLDLVGDELDPTSNTATTMVDVMRADLSVTMSDAADPVLVGQHVTYQLTVTNHGPESASNVVLHDLLPATVVLTSVSEPCTQIGQELTCDLGEVPDGHSVAIEMEVLSTVAADLVNVATVSSEIPDPVPTNNIATETTSVDPILADLAVTLTDQVHRVALESDITYHAVVTNHGPQPATNVLLTQVLPLHAVVVSVSRPFIQPGSVVTVDLGTLEPGAVVPIEIVVAETRSGPISSTATITSDVADLNSSNNSDSDTSFVLGPAGSADIFFFTFSSSGVVGDVPYDDEDILSLDTTTGQWAMYFDGSLVGLSGSDVDAFHVQPDGSILMSFDANAYPGDLGLVRDADIVRFTPSSLGTLTAGSFDWFLDGSDVGLNPTSGDVDAISFTPDGRLVVSVPGSLNVVGLGVEGEDLFVLNQGVFGADTTGQWAMYYDGSDAGLGGSKLGGSAIDVATGDIYVAAPGGFTNHDLTAQSSDILLCEPALTGDPPECTFSLAFDGSDHALDNRDVIDGIQIGRFTGQEVRGQEVIYMSLAGNTSTVGLTIRDEDIFYHDTRTGAWRIFFDGSDVGISTDVDGFHLLDDGSVLMSFNTSMSVPGVGAVLPPDIVRFLPSSTGDLTAGTFELYFDGSDVELTKSAEGIDAIGFAPDGSLLVSTTGSYAVGGINGRDADLLKFTADSLGENTAGSWQLYFDGSDVELTSTSEDITGVTVSPVTGELYYNTLGTVSAGGVRGNGSDILICAPGTFGESTSCEMTLAYDGSTHGVRQTLDAIHVVKPGDLSGANLVVSQSDSADPVTVGENVTYQVTVSNLGPEAADNVVLTDVLPAGATFVSATSPCTETGGTVTCNLGQLDPGDSVLLDIVVATTQVGQLGNTATVSSDTEDPSEGNNTATETTDVHAPQADLGLVISDTADPVTLGQNVVYSLTVTNHGPEPATNVVLTDTLPAGVTLVSATPPCDQAGGIVTCSLGNMPLGSEQTITIEVTPTQAGQLSNAATVSSETTDLVGSNDSAAETTDVNPLQADLVLSISDDVDPVTVGDNITYSVSVTNNGPEPAEDVVVTQTLPSSVAYQSSTGPCVESDGVVTCNLGGLDDGGTASFDIVVATTEPGPVSSDANVASDTVDLDVSNNSQSESTTVLGLGGSTEIAFVSFSTSGTVGNVSYADEDILAFDMTTGGWSMYFDGSRVGLSGSDVNAFHVQADGSILLSFDANTYAGDLGLVRDADIVRFTPSSHGVLTEGSFDWFLDGSDVGLNATGGDIDAIGFTSDGRLLVSVPGNLNLPGGKVANEDLLVLEGGVFGADSSGDWSLYFDGSDVGLAGNDVWGSSVDAATGNVYLTTKNGFSAGGISGDGADILLCHPTSVGDQTDCTFSLALDGGSHGLASGQSFDGIQIGSFTGQEVFGQDVIYMSLAGNASAFGLTIRDEDIFYQDTRTGAWRMFFDGSDLGITSDVDGFHLQDDGSVLMSFNTSTSVPDIGTVLPPDIVRFVPSSTGDVTAGSFKLHFDGSDVGLITSAEGIDAIGFAPDGNLLVSTTGPYAVGGISGKDADLLKFTADSLGENTAGSWQLYFDGSDVELTSTAEDITGVTVSPVTGELYYSTLGTVSAGGVRGTGSDILICSAGTFGDNTSCEMTLAYDGSTHGLTQTLDAIHVKQAQLPVTAGGIEESSEELVASANLNELPISAPSPFQNLAQPTDVTNDGIVSASDALHVINELGARRYSDELTSEVVDPLSLDTWPGIYFDSSGDDRITALDALLVVNALGADDVFDAEAESQGQIPWQAKEPGSDESVRTRSADLESVRKIASAGHRPDRGEPAPRDRVGLDDPPDSRLPLRSLDALLSDEAFIGELTIRYLHEGATRS